MRSDHPIPGLVRVTSIMHEGFCAILHQLRVNEVSRKPSSGEVHIHDGEGEGEKMECSHER